MNLMQMLVDFSLQSTFKDNSVGVINKQESSNDVQIYFQQRQTKLKNFEPEIFNIKIKDLTTKNKCFDYFQDFKLNDYKMYEFKPARNHVIYKIKR